MKPKSKPHLCAVCGKYEFSYWGSFDVCKECGWIDDPVQTRYPDEWGGANRMSLTEARQAYKEGKPIE